MKEDIEKHEKRYWHIPRIKISSEVKKRIVILIVGCLLLYSNVWLIAKYDIGLGLEPSTMRVIVAVVSWLIILLTTINLAFKKLDRG